MGAARSRQHRRARADFERLAVDRHHPAPAEDVVDLVLGLLVIADARAGLECALAEYQSEVRRLLEERIPDRLATAVVRARLVRGDVSIALENVAAGRGLLRRIPEPAAEHQSDYHD